MSSSVVRHECHVLGCLQFVLERQGRLQQVRKKLLAVDVTANDGLEEEFDLFRTVTKEANSIFNYEEFGITTLFTYLRIPIQRLVARLNVNSTNVQADISRVVH